ncbi:hypothetical protein ACV344_29830 [Pseudomonas aeruginosa]|uniref:hypothetical protein n=1 Tax=Pseudomonas aeruginosa TaxID=287 RepID=UPI000F54AA07|nr:hypothetical protein [Pseudomonas aeruginosa]MBA5106209.1 hypothetical protein [Pseudomonas aeruginosa]MBD1300235.1 hypothetical protein [Pseudomonas aeruginosa]MBD1340782.1 hypothetical protein [Pseudomonas aeruginosa]MBG4604185.1 hypothetical protein [Pseudomonas aeruginosa]MBH3592976.1 hypothetical protein [Pseudomonas aeruginosa]
MSHEVNLFSNKVLKALEAISAEGPTSVVRLNDLAARIGVEHANISIDKFVAAVESIVTSKALPGLSIDRTDSTPVIRIS